MPTHRIDPETFGKDDQKLEIIKSGDAYEAIIRGEVDVQISTAKRFPRSISKFQDRIREMACLNKEIAASCTYSLPRGGKNIFGPSVRMAEICATAWGNLRTAQRVLGEGQSHITCNAVCHDLETNVAASVEVLRRITKKDGSRYDDDMMTIAGNAGCSIAYRNAVFKVIPKAFWAPIWEEARMVARGDGQTIGQLREEAIADFEKTYKVTLPMLLARLGKRKVEDIDLDDIDFLIGLKTAIEEGSTTPAAAFAPREPEEPEKPKASYLQAPNELEGLREVRQPSRRATPEELARNLALKADEEKRMATTQIPDRQPGDEEAEWTDQPPETPAPAAPSGIPKPGQRRAK